MKPALRQASTRFRTGSSSAGPANDQATVLNNLADRPEEPMTTDVGRARRRKWLRRLALLPVVLGILLALAWGLLARDLPELQPWHTESPRGEMTAADITEGVTLAD